MGYAHPDKLLDELTSTQLNEWVAYNTIDPIGAWRNDFQFSCLFSLISNIAIKLSGGEDSKLTKPKDFQFIYDEVEQEKQLTIQSVEEIKRVMQSIQRAQNRKVDKTTKRNKK